MESVQTIVSSDRKFCLVFFQRNDQSCGFVELEHSDQSPNIPWEAESYRSPRFASLDIAIQEAEGRIGWLKRETLWPAKALPTVIASEYVPDWIKCPFCHVRFSLLDPHRWAGDRHLTCGQTIQVERLP
jgi:hypothetical protein